MKNSQPILVAPLFRPLDQHLVSLLKSLTSEDWHRPTVCSAWTVKDIAAHLLDTALRRLSRQRDGFIPEIRVGNDVGGKGGSESPSGETLVQLVHRWNAEWTTALSRVSPRILVELTEHFAPPFADFIESLDPMTMAEFPVSWAGEASSLQWFDIAREYTERWHHQRQIALAVGYSTPIDARDMYHPALETFFRALPFVYRSTDAPPGTLVQVRVVGPAGGDWFVCRRDHGWILEDAPESSPAAIFTMPQEIAWRFLTKRTTRSNARTLFPEISLSGEIVFAEPILGLVAIIA